MRHVLECWFIEQQMKFIIKHTFFNILIMGHRLKVHTEDLAPTRFSCAKSRSFHWIKSNSFYSIALQVYFCMHIIYFLHLKNISSKNIKFIKKIILLTCDIWQRSITSQPLSNCLFKMDRLYIANDQRYDLYLVII